LQNCLQNFSARLVKAHINKKRHYPIKNLNSKLFKQVFRLISANLRIRPGQPIVAIIEFKSESTILHDSR